MVGRKPAIAEDQLKEIYTNEKYNLFSSAEGNLIKCTSDIWINIINDYKLSVTSKSIYLAIKRFHVKQESTKEDSIANNSNSELSSISTNGNSSLESCIDDSKNKSFFKIFMPKDVWQTHKPELKIRKRCQSKTKKVLALTGSWVHTLNTIIYKNCKLPCVWQFKDHHIALTNESKYYLQLIGKCECNSIIEICKDNEENINPLEDGIFLDCTIMNYNNTYSHNKKCQVTGVLRNEIGSDMIMKGQTASYKRKIMAAEYSNLFLKEPPILPKMETLRKIKSDIKNIDRGNIDPIIEIANFGQKTPCNNIIHEIGYNKFFLHYWSPEQLRLYNYYCKKEVGTVCVDATGGVCNKLKRVYGQSGHIMLYSIVIHLKNETEGQVPVCQMLSERNNTNAIQYWLGEWRRLGATVPKIFICDHSMAIISAACRAFSGDFDSNSYVSRCFNLCLGKISVEKPTCFIRIDVAHLIKSVMTWNCIKYSKLRIRQFYMRAIGQLIICTDINEFENLLYDIFVVATKEFEGHIGEQETICELSKQRLINKFSHGVQQSCVREIIETDFLVDGTETVFTSHQDVSEDISGSRTDIKNWINNIYERATILEDAGNRDNIMYSTEIAKSIMKLCYRFPLWTGVMVKIFGNGNLTATSTHVESYFNDLKNRLFTKLPLRVDAFVYEHLHILEGTMKLASGLKYFYESTSLSSENKTEKDERTENDDNEKAENNHISDTNNILNMSNDMEVELRTVENWMGKSESPQLNKKRKKISKYMNPSPEWKTMEMSINNINRAVKIGVLKNGGKIESKCSKTNAGKTFTVNNTCAIDTVLQILSAIYCDSRNAHQHMESNEISIFNLAIALAKHNVKKDIYDQRLDLLLKLFPSVQIAHSNLYRIDCVTNIIGLINKLDIVSVIYASECRSCRNVQNINVKIITPLNVDDLQHLELSLNESRNCQKCGSHDIDTDNIYSDIICIDTSLVQPDKFVEIAKEVVLNEIANTISIDKDMFVLRGAIHFTAPSTMSSAGHYIAYIKRLSYYWEAYDDLQDKAKVVSGNTAINCAVLFYSK